MRIDARYHLNPSIDTEAELHSKLSMFLQDTGFYVRNEVRADNGGYVDIVATNNKIIYVIECKKRLRKHEFFVARGQLEWYTPHYHENDDRYKKMIIYGGLRRKEFDKDTAHGEVIVMWYYDALHFFDAHHDINDHEAVDFRNVETNLSKFVDQVDGLKRTPDFVEYIKHTISQNHLSYWQREAQFGTGCLKAVAQAAVEIADEPHSK